MTTLVLVGCLLACSICVYAGDSTSNGHLVISSEHSVADVVQPGNKYFVVEGSQVRIQCKAIVNAENDHPPSVGWTKVNTADWSLEKVGSDSEKTVSDLVLTRVNASHAGRYDCVAAHSLANQSIELFVSSDSAPPKKLGPVNKNETLTLECKASKPEWTFNGMPITDSNVKQDGNKLTIELPVGARTGVYMCSASGDGGIAQRQMFQVRGAPEIEHSATNKNLMEGEKAVLKCDVVGYPVPAIKWQKKAETGEITPVVAKSGKVELSAHKGMKDALLSISNLEYSDSGEYTCMVESAGIGDASFTISLRVKDKLAALWPFLGIVVEVIVLVAVIFIYEKRRSSKDETVVDEEDDEEEQKKALTTGETVDVRQRGVKT